MVFPGMDNASVPFGMLCCLCDDGTIWSTDAQGYGAWNQMQGPEHLAPIRSSYTVRRTLEEGLDAKSLKLVHETLRSGGVRL